MYHVSPLKSQECNIFEISVPLLHLVEPDQQVIKSYFWRWKGGCRGSITITSTANLTKNSKTGQ